MDYKSKLYKRSGVIIGAFFGSVIAATFFATQNLRTLGKEDQIKKTWIVGVSITIAGFIIITVIQCFVKMTSTPLVVAQIFAFVAYYDQLIGTRKNPEGHEFYSNWRAFGIGLIFLCFVLAVSFFVIYGLMLLGVPVA